MTAAPGARVRVHVDVANPGQFFACCGLLELADRLWGGADGWFEGDMFAACPRDASRARDSSLPALMSKIAEATLAQLDADDEYASPLNVPAPFGLRLDWWNDKRAGESDLKVWAGRMSNVRIARAMQNVLRQPAFHDDGMFSQARVVYDPADASKVEPFSFDARRGESAHPLDVGFERDPLGMPAAAYPAVEALCLVGLQRCRPRRTIRRVFVYHTWEAPVDARLAPSAVCGLLPWVRSRAFRFESVFRTSQRKHKAYRMATRLQGDDDDRS